MITADEARRLANDLEARLGLDRSQLLDAAARAAGYSDWKALDALSTQPADDVGRQRVIPILRMFDHKVAEAFYCDFLGFDWQSEHQFEPNLPVYAQVELNGCVLHLSEHHGDATPGSGVMIVVENLEAYHSELLAKKHRNARPGIRQNPWGPTMTITDPFGNRLSFWERT